jgi:hypothetical protein
MEGFGNWDIEVLGNLAALGPFRALYGPATKLCLWEAL